MLIFPDASRIPSMKTGGQFTISSQTLVASATPKSCYLDLDCEGKSCAQTVSHEHKKPGVEDAKDGPVKHTQLAGEKIGGSKRITDLVMCLAFFNFPSVEQIILSRNLN